MQINELVGFKMLSSARFFVRHPELRKGGLVICGLNFGADDAHPVDLEEIEHKIDQTLETFMLPRIGYETDNLRKNVGNWFRKWKDDKCDWVMEENSELDRAILLTNMFYNFTRGCSDKEFILDDEATAAISDSAWDIAVKRLFDAGEKYEVSGYLIVGKSSRDAIFRYLEHKMGNAKSCWLKDVPPGLEFIRHETLNIAMTYHYAFPKTKSAYIEEIAPAMRFWLADVLARSRKSQEKVTAAGIPYPWMPP